MSNFGSYVKALRKAFTHLTEEPQFMAYMTKRDVKPLVILLIHEEGGCVKMYTSSFLCTKPRLSQARALLFPKVFVPLGIQKFSL